MEKDRHSNVRDICTLIHPQSITASGSEQSHGLKGSFHVSYCDCLLLGVSLHAGC